MIALRVAHRSVVLGGMLSAFLMLWPLGHPLRLLGIA